MLTEQLQGVQETLKKILLNQNKSDNVTARRWCWRVLARAVAIWWRAILMCI
jgi:hypothetical protein